MRLVSARREDADIPEAWQARVDLAAAHRLAERQGFSEGIFNHFTLAVPGIDDRYLQLPFRLHWSEASAGCFVEVGCDGRVLSGVGEIERSAYCIHAPIHRLIPSAACVLHTHMPHASALIRLANPISEAHGQPLGYEAKLVAHLLIRLTNPLSDALGQLLGYEAKAVAHLTDTLGSVPRLARDELRRPRGCGTRLLHDLQLVLRHAASIAEAPGTAKPQHVPGVMGCNVLRCHQG